LNASRPPTIPPVPSPRREEIERSTVGFLKKGAAEKADLRLVDTGGKVVVVKDFAEKPWWGRLLGRVQIRREAAAYRWLEGEPGIPRLIGRVDALAIAIERVEGEQLAFAASRVSEGARHLAKLRALIDRLHARGVVHNDLRGRENVLLRGDGEIVVVDLAGALRLRPGGLAHRVFFDLFALADETAFLKWKDLLAPGPYTLTEQAYLARHRRWRALWPFNRKRARAGIR
jgi:predicted Ser/Thr protein kinase